MRFSSDEVEDIAFRIGFKDAQLWGHEATMPQKILSLVNTCDNMLLLNRLEALMYALRPDLQGSD